MDAVVSAAYAQLISLGLLWITFHCAGMCGPLVLGLDLGGCTRGANVGRVGAHLAAYQLGRATVYALLGALAGLLGRSISDVLQHAAPYFSVVLGLGMILWPLRGHLQRRSDVVTLGQRPLLPRVMTRLVALADGRSIGRSWVLGTIMAGLPCMIVAWALVVAASTRSPLHGALVMLLLVLMTTVPLGSVMMLARMLRLDRVSLLQRIPSLLLPISGVWMLLVAGAALGVVPHVSLGWEWGGRGYVIMFW
ncbi:MAG: sulfite exporter TauE/SafE family protein [Myxococcota bacterium]